MPILPSSRFVAVDRGRFQLHLYVRRLPGWRFKRVATYPIAVGAKGHKTPPGLYGITAKAKDPEWQAPNEDWVDEEDRGKIWAGDDPNNPIKSRFMRLTDDGIGIHGTAAEDSIGTRASHGCIRMTVPDVKALYHEVPKHTLVYII